MLNVGLVGATGRMGNLLAKNIEEDANCHLSAILLKEGETIDSETFKGIGISTDMKTFLDSCDGVIDFSLPEATENLLSTLLDENISKPLVIGTTGFNEHQKNLLKQASSLMPICYSSNMSLGVAILNRVVHLVSKQLENFDCEIVEQHHRYKKDAPSGTALTLAHTAAVARGLDIDKVRISGRDGDIGAREKDEIGVMSLRGGDIVGRHTVGFYNDGEFLELHHTATSRETFSKGALRLFKWLMMENKEAGLYSINDFLAMHN